MSTRALCMTGRCANGFERGGGTRYHAVPEDRCGNGRAGAALCGAKPGRRSAWSDFDGAAVTCPRCVKKLQALTAPVECSEHPFHRVRQGAKTCTTCGAPTELVPESMK